jgi:hypothetical protein
MANTGLIRRTKDTDKAEDKALGQTKEFIKRTTKKKNIKEAKEINYFKRRSAMFVIN